MNLDAKLLNAPLLPFRFLRPDMRSSEIGFINEMNRTIKILIRRAGKIKEEKIGCQDRIASSRTVNCCIEIY